MRPRISPRNASSERPWRAGWPSYDFQSCCNSIAARAMRNAGPVLRGAEDVLCLRERDEGEVEASGFPVQAREVQERPAPPLEMGAIVLAVEPIEGVEQERFGPFRVVPVRREYAGREERLSNDAGIAGLLGVVQAGIEGAAGVVPATEFHQRVALAQEGEGAHRRIGRGLGEFGIEVGGLRP